ncbi:CpaD family pilus assembly protein [Sphingomonas sp. PAMC 26605]|uniref:CpaD family pilus assembly protein n=1 Tax=Sphingomonas sp. PAMC 26605 TaxID=1112214 RepID=UPI00026CABFA|nr:CpaD family pilus assembly lipoprotein [Sphingomonas sp. PAMC 26605]
MFKRTLRIATALAPVLLAPACAGTQNRGLESVHQPVVSRTDYALDVATSGGDLAPGEEQRLAGWMTSLRLGYGDRVAIDDPNPYGAGVHDAVARQVAHYGLLVSDDAPVTNAPIAAGTIRVVVTRMKARVPGCPDYSRNSSTDFESNTSSNYGCSSNATLAAMIANPADLVLGQAGSGVVDQLASAKAIDSFRRAAPSGSGGSAIKTESAGGK